jgi:thiamine monophosphate synthase
MFVIFFCTAALRLITGMNIISQSTFFQNIERIIGTGAVDFLQFNNNTISDDIFLKNATMLTKIMEKHPKTALIIGNRLNIAKHIRAVAVHFDLPFISLIGKESGTCQCWGLSIKDEYQAGYIPSCFDYLSIGPVFENWDSSRSYIELIQLRQIRKKFPDLPIFVSGTTTGNIRQIMQYADGVDIVVPTIELVKNLRAFEEELWKIKQILTEIETDHNQR